MAFSLYTASSSFNVAMFLIGEVSLLTKSDPALPVDQFSGLSVSHHCSIHGLIDDPSLICASTRYGDRYAQYLATGGLPPSTAAFPAPVHFLIASLPLVIAINPLSVTVAKEKKSSLPPVKFVTLIVSHTPVVVLYVCNFNLEARIKYFIEASSSNP